MKGLFPKFFYALLTLLFLLHTRFNWATNGVGVKCIEKERKALLMFKQGIQDGFGMLSTWRDEGNEDCCNWKGVRCSNETGHVQILDLRGSISLYLRGTINITLLIELHDMKNLDLSSNHFFSSGIPKFIDSFTNLRYLNLSYSYFYGSIPYQLGRLSNLLYIDLSYNMLDGAIPCQLGNLSKLQYLNLQGNYLYGEIPYQLGNISMLQYLNLQLNYLYGVIPYQLGDLYMMQYLNIQENDLVGVIPYQFGNLSMLQSLKLDYNFNLTIDEQNNHVVEWLSKLSSLRNLGLSAVSDIGYSHHWLQMIGKLVPNLRELRLSECGLSYAHNLFLTTSFSNYSSSLVILDLSNNNLSSVIFQWSFNFSFNLQELYLENCSLSVDNLDFLFSHFHFSSLGILDFSYNNLMSVRALNFSSNLQELYLSNCSLSSSSLILTSSNSNLSSLVKLYLNFNQLTSPTIFYWISNFTSNLHELDLSSNLIKGPIPDGFGKIMNSLEHLYLSHNKLQGELPTSLGNICTLKGLYLSSNNLSGELSSFIYNSSWCNRHTLQDLDLFRNRMTGMLPDLSIFPSLQSVDLSNNQLSGEIPESIRLLAELQVLYLDWNYLEGVITTTFNNLSSLQFLSLSHNLALRISTSWVPPFQLRHLEMASCILGPNFPNWLHNQNNLFSLDISNGGISSFVPEWFWPLLENFYFINISHNNFVGKIPNLSLKLNYQPEIILTSNNFEGAIPSFFLQASALYLSNNKFSDLVPLLCDKIEDEGLHVLDVSSNLLRGQLPDCWSNLNSLKYVDFSNNNLSGEIPPSIGSLENMEALVLRSNSLIGELSSSLGNCSKLLLLDVSENKLLGPIPSWIGESLGELQILSLRINYLYGSLPLHLCHLTHIRLLDLSHNNLSNEIPPCLKNFTIMAQASIDLTNIAYHLYRSNVTSPGGNNYDFVDFYIKLMWKGEDYLFKRPEFLLKSIDLSNNALTGEIPKEFVSLLGLVSLNLSRNNLSGKIPIEIGNLESLEFLDLSSNKLSGTIPSSLAHIYRLTTLDLSNNSLSGKIPVGTQLQSFDASSYKGNLDLCGMPLDKKCLEDETPAPQVFDNEDDDSLFSQEFYLSLGLGFAIGFWGFLGPLLFNHSWRQAYYRLVEKVTNRIFVMVAIFVARHLIIKD